MDRPIEAAAWPIRLDGGPAAPNRTAGSLAELDAPEEDRILDEIYQDRKRDVRRDVRE